jgi:hypothetical protein
MRPGRRVDDQKYRSVPGFGNWAASKHVDDNAASPPTRTARRADVWPNDVTHQRLDECFLLVAFDITASLRDARTGALRPSWR